VVDTEFLCHLSELEDPRKDINKSNALLDVVFLTLAAVPSGVEGWKANQRL
jgi:hypothetical protein